MNHIRQEIKALTGLRAVAAFWVLLFHLEPYLRALHPTIGALAAPIALPGYLGVDLFFVLSGFVISYNYADRLRPFDVRQYLRFLWARLARIYPVHLFTLFILVAFVVYRNALGDPLQPAERYTWSHLIDNLALVHGWSVPIEKTWTLVSWSISTEWLAYLLFPLVSALAFLLHDRRAIIAACLGLLMLGAVAYLSSNFRGTMAYGLVRIAVEFSVGCLVYRLYRQRYFPEPRWCLAYSVIWILAVPSGIAFLGFVPKLLTWAPALLALLVLGLSADRGLLCRWLQRPLVMYWGRVSYSLYMVHFLVIIILRSYLPASEIAALSAPARAAVLIGLVATILCASAFTYHFVEQPCRRRMLLGLRRHAAEPRPEMA